MRRKIRYYRLVWLRYDLPAGLSVFLVALPLCLGIALTSGAPLYAGLLCGMVGGLVVSFISGSQLGVSGPAAGLTTLVAATIAATGDYRVFLVSVIIAGLFQLLLGILRLGTIASYFPSSVIKGMLAAIGVLLVSRQIPIALGYDQPDFWNSGFLQLFRSENIPGNFTRFNAHISRGVLIISIVSLFLMFLLQRPFFKKRLILPPALVVVLAGIFMNYIFSENFPDLALRSSQLVHIPENIFDNIRFPEFSSLFTSTLLWKQGLLIGVLATLETLLCVEAIDKLDTHNRITPVNRELVAQGFGNMICGFIGAIPMTAVVVRGAANVDAGARTRLSAFTHGIFLLLTVLLIPGLLSLIPFASLAVILLVTGYNLTKPRLFRNMWGLGFKQFLPFLFTIVVILLTDLLTGVSIGLLVSAYFIIRNNFKAEYRVIRTGGENAGDYLIRLNTNVTFLNKVNLQKALDQIPEDSALIIDGSESNFIDYDILEIISEYANKAKDRNIALTLKGIKQVDITAIH
jgi:MFS superfamily sulfate permease-like transporter